MILQKTLRAQLPIRSIIHMTLGPSGPFYVCMGLHFPEVRDISSIISHTSTFRFGSIPVQLVAINSPE